ncbi:GrpB family protein [uncultured Cardiobacterium sp.]|uniref:GrpB family protein n=1 Tax=uncultured Cardiobacterium sp. TaxID=417619 RepID=UPI00261A40F9|nr:GrpB family protein [uncultured Cardiobacterium sp.]
MTKPLTEMSLQELWQLFPIQLTPHRDEWRDWYAAEARHLQQLLHGHIRAIAHIGSTAILGIWAKPIIDILIEVADAATLQNAANILLAHGYLQMSASDTRISLNKGYTPEGFAERVFHIHLRLPGDHDEYYFRDYLREHPAIARQYEALKLSLWKPYEHDRDGYTNAKGDFIRAITARAKSGTMPHF